MQSNLRLNKLQLVVLLVVLFAAAFGMAQGITTGSISGTVLDPSSAVVVGATVTAQNTATGGTLTTLTNDTGYFTFRSVPPGTYRVTIAGTGFRRPGSPLRIDPPPLVFSSIETSARCSTMGIV